MIPALPLRWALLLLFPTLSHQTSGYFSVKVQSPVSGFLGSSVSLHCAVANNMDVRHLAVRWYRPKMSDTPVLFYKNTQIQKSPVDVQYQGRVFLLGELEKGDVSLKLENLTLADRGDYVCHVSSDDWYDEATVSLRVRVVGSSPVLSLNEAEGGKMNVSCQSHGWLPEPSITWTDKDGKDLKHLSKVKFTNNSEEFIDVSSWLIVSPSESEWISCSVGFSDQERKEGRIIPHTPTGDAVLIDLKRKRATENTLLTCETSGTPSERKHLYKNCVENEDKNEAPTADTDHHSVDGDLDQVKKFKVNITIDPNETPALLTHKGKEIKCSVPKQNWDRNNEDEKIFTLCKEKFNSALPLRWALLLLFPTLSHQTSGYFSVKVQSPVSGFLGSSVSLHCAVANNMDVRHLAVRWYRPKMSDTPVLFYKNTQIQKSPVDVQYQGRVFLLGELEKGDVSL
ncbi:hypothetical protein PHYPO_G00248450 [Pangasianodon hypophthalmus]|uniref:Ig-like domain-containing protein n=1 Tax=Pangasianodon hypophthalmus TaxID=310915 RepID=A0A5N5J8T8_PANHP|nr:hypothetical protein PHYPO_G00248450 [Pangasianodon hypophthalmus]